MCFVPQVPVPTESVKMRGNRQARRRTEFCSWNRVLPLTLTEQLTLTLSFCPAGKGHRCMDKGLQNVDGKVNNMAQQLQSKKRQHHSQDVGLLVSAFYGMH